MSSEMAPRINGRDRMKTTPAIGFCWRAGSRPSLAPRRRIARNRARASAKKWVAARKTTVPPKA
jgi:hypothetical protein